MEIGQLYSNEEIFKSLRVSNAGGIRLSLQDGAVGRAVIMTSVESFHTAGENPYRDRLEGGVLTYTAAGKLGQQTLAGTNSRIIEQAKFPFPIHGFALTASRRDKSVGSARWRYLGLLEYLRHYQDTQLDAEGKIRKVWIFELRVLDGHRVVPLANDFAISAQTIGNSELREAPDPDNEIVERTAVLPNAEMRRVEHVRGKLLAMEPKRFEFFLKDLLIHCGFYDVCVTKFSSDGGVDLNARVGKTIWIFEHTLVQVQAKRWLHSVGRKEIAELRGSLQPFARGAVITTSHFSKAAINEATENGKLPIGLIDGFRLSEVVLGEKFQLPPAG
ncbi:MAG: restriction endonuclease [Candidatus Acidiferrales bacterium]